MNRLFFPLLSVVVFLLTACTTSTAPLPTVATVDLDRYLGVWHQIALLPNRFQAQCVAETHAQYAREGDAIAVLNRCRTAEGKVEQVRGVAHVVAGSGGAKLRVSFFRPFYGDYWVLALDPDYRWALVGEPGRKYAWILARTPTLDVATYTQLLQRATELGFDRQAFVPTPGALSASQTTGETVP